MAGTEPYADVQQVVHISTSIGTGCKHCGESIGLEQFAQSINHYIQAHGYKLLHVGQETEHGSEGPWQSTVAVLGR